jgi:Plasma-membrane choline transporter.
VLLVILVMRKRIKLVIQLFKEAGKAINSMPLLLLEPLLVSDYSLIPEIYCTVLSKESWLRQRDRKTTEEYQQVERTQVNYFATADDSVLKNSTFIFPILGPVMSDVQYMSAEFIDGSNISLL